MKTLHTEAEASKSHSNGANGSSNGTVSLNGSAAPVEVAPGVFMVPGRKMSFAEAQASSLAENAELYRRLAK